MKRRSIVLISLAISISTIILLYMQGRWLSMAGEMQKEELSSTMHDILDKVVTELDVESEQTEYGSKGLISTNFRQNQYTKKIITNAGIVFQETSWMDMDAPLFNVRDTLLASLIKDAIKNHPKEFFESRKDLAFGGRFANRFDIQRETRVTMSIPIEKRISMKEVDSLITQQLKERKIKTAHEFAIEDQNHKAISPIMKTNGYRYDNPDRIYSEQLFPNDATTSKKYYLSIYIPHLTNYLFREMLFMIFIATLVIIIIVSTFAATLIMIFRQKKISQMRSDFMSNMTHELKTPIATITLASEMLQDTTVPNEKKNISGLSKMIRDESQRLSSLVERVLRLAAFERGNINLKHKDVDIQNIVKKVVSNYALQFESKGVKVSTDYSAKDVIITGDETHITQIVSNLIDNALKYSKENPKIKISTYNEQNGIIIAVSDNGIGIGKEYQKRIFEQFFRVPTGNIHAVKGSGLGLNYVKQIAEMHGGSVSVESEKGKGSTFRIFFPNKLSKNKKDNNNNIKNNNQKK